MGKSIFFVCLRPFGHNIVRPFAVDIVFRVSENIVKSMRTQNDVCFAQRYCRWQTMCAESATILRLKP